MKRLLLILITIFSLFWSNKTLAQKDDIPFMGDWRIGRVYLSNGDSLKGLVAYNFQADIIQVKSAQKEYTLTSMKITHFEVEEDTVTRIFRVYNYHNKEDFEVPILFEELIINDLFKVLLREEVAYENRASFMGQGFIPDREMYVSYFYMEDGKIYSFEDSKKELLHLMQDKKEEIQAFIKKERIRFFSRDEVQMIFNYYYDLRTNAENSSNE